MNTADAPAQNRPAAVASESLLRVRDLSVEFETRRGVARVLESVAFDLRRGETLGIVGESGCGKSMTALAIMRLIPTPPGKNGTLQPGKTDLVI